MTLKEELENYFIGLIEKTKLGTTSGYIDENYEYAVLLTLTLEEPLMSYYDRGVNYLMITSNRVNKKKWKKSVILGIDSENSIWQKFDELNESEMISLIEQFRIRYNLNLKEGE